MSSDKVFICGGFNGHVGREGFGFSEVPGGHRAGHWNDGDVQLMNYAFGKRMKLMNTCTTLDLSHSVKIQYEIRLIWRISLLIMMNTYFHKPVGQSLTYTSGHTETVVGYILVNCCYSHRMKDWGRGC